jgi:GxxExxY protein
MSIELEHPTIGLNDSEFHALDYSVMSLAFDLYNSIGNLWNEDDYKLKLAQRCNDNDLTAFTEIPLKVSYQDFSKYYFIDMLIEGSVYEMKTVAKIASRHESQTLNYLFLTDTHHGKIINFRPDSLEWRFVSTSLSTAQRKNASIDTSNWVPPHHADIHLPDLLTELLHHWGAYLDVNLYKEATLFFLGIESDNTHRRFVPQTNDTLLHFTCLGRKRTSYANNLEKYLQASSYRQIDWVNFDRKTITLQSLRKK